MIENADLYKRLILQYGKEMQIVVAIEELAELQKELTKWLRGIGSIEHIAEELADAGIMLQQLEFIFACTDEVIDTRYKKLERIEKLVELDENDTRDE